MTSTESPAARWVIGALTATVLLAVVVVLYAFPGRTAPGHPGILPTVNAVLNAGSAAFLVAGFLFIKNRNIRAHRLSMLTAFGLSTLFLLGYVAHHAQVGSVPYHGTGALRDVYFAVLIPHIVLAAVVVPMALLTIYRGWTKRYKQHKKVARWTLPVWLFVSVSGVIVYWMLYHLGA